MRQWQAYDGWVWAITFAPDSASLWTAGAGPFLDQWDTDGRHLRRIDGLTEFPGIAFSPDGDRVAVAWRGRLRLADADTLSPLAEFALRDLAGPISLAFAPDGRTVYAADRRACWRIRPGGPAPDRWELNGVYVDAWCRDGDHVLVSSWRPLFSRVVVRHAESGSPAWEEIEGPETGRGVQGTALARDGSWLAVGHHNGDVVLRDRATRAAIVLDGHEPRGVLGLTAHPSGQLLATAGADGTVRLWEVPGGRPRACFDPGIGPMNRVAFAPDGLTLAATSDRGILALIDVDA